MLIYYTHKCWVSGGHVTGRCQGLFPPRPQSQGKAKAPWGRGWDYFGFKLKSSILLTDWLTAGADPDLQIGGDCHSDPEIRGRGPGTPKLFSALRASFWWKNKVGGRPRAPLLDPPLNWLSSTYIHTYLLTLILITTCKDHWLWETRWIVNCAIIARTRKIPKFAAAQLRHMLQ